MPEPCDWKVFLDSNAAKEFTPAILASWRRSLVAGVDKGRRGRPPRVSAEELGERLARSGPLLEVARGHLRSLSASFGHITHTAYLTDRDGIVLHSEGDEQLRVEFGLLPGYNWSEPVMGTNGAGTALASGAAVAVVGPEHFIDSFQNSTCVAAPIRDPQGELIGAIDLSTAASDGGPQHIPFVTYVASMIERDLAHKLHEERSLEVAQLASTLAAREVELRQANERLKLILDNAPVFIYLVDHADRFLEVNRGWLEKLGIQSDSVIGRSLFDVFPMPSAEQFARNNKRVLSARGAMHFEEVLEGRTYLSVKVPVHDPAGDTYAICGMSVDITDRKFAEQRVLASEQALREADRKKDRFLAALAHELRNPLAPILSAVQTMRLAGSDRPEMRRARDVVDRQVNQLVRLVDELLDISRITLGKIHLQKEVVDLREIAEDARVISESLIREAQHDFVMNRHPHPVWVHGDSVRLAQVISNLLNNAARYTPRGGSISLSVTQEGQDAVVSVQDNGVGIAADQMERIFEPFVQAEQPSGAPSPGLGVGLMLVKRLSEAHGGSVTVASEGLGRGSRFAVRLPLAQPGAAKIVQRPRNVPQTPGWRMLIIEDNPDFAHSQRDLLRLLGLEVEVAFDGKKGLEVVGTFGPQVVLLDLSLPGLSGYEVARRIRALPRGDEITLIAQTGWGETEIRDQVIAAGFDAHVTKPMDVEALIGLLHSLRS